MLSRSSLSWLGPEPGAHPLYGPLLDAPRLVLGQLGQSLDGRIATITGDSFHVGCPEALLHLHRLRALMEAVVVGIGTVLADDPQLTVRHCEGPDPVRVVIDPRGRLPAGARLLRAGAPVLVVTTPGRGVPPGAEPLPLPAPGGRFAPGAILGALAARGLRRVLVEGGAATISAFLAAGRLDRLHLCVAPLLIGSGKTGIDLPPVTRLGEALRPAARTHALGSDVLFDLDLRPAG